MTDPPVTKEALRLSRMDQERAKTSAGSSDAPGLDPCDFAELLVSGVQELLGASDDDARRWRERLVEVPRLPPSSNTPVVPPRSGRR